MATVKALGFTIIELMLFLGISGALFAALMIGVNSNITQQRYRESVQDYKALLQDQYSEVMNPRNDRDGKWKCEDGMVVQAPNDGEPRGTSSCVLLGRAIQIMDDGTSVQTRPVFGVEPRSQDAPSDIEALIAYKPKISTDFDTVKTSLDWGSQLVTAEHQPSMASFLILRSPVSGLIRVFNSPGRLPIDLTTLLTTDAATLRVKNCVRGQTGLLPTQSITVDANVASAEGVSVNENDQTCA